ncbi:MAG: heme A synthase [Opitutales bacterium]|nr:heme A synthase [Opitutales bacterium]
MLKSALQNRSNTWNPFLAGFAFLTLLVTIKLLYAGGFTTTIGAGMVFPDWPLSNGSLNPPGWTTDEAMLAEHGHRLLGALVGFLTLMLAVWVHLREERAWVRRLAWAALAFVIFQGLLGGFRVLLVSLDLAKIHGITAQLFLCTLVALVAGLSRWWRGIPQKLSAAVAREWSRLRWIGLALCGLIFVQLIVGAVVRHRGAGLAISSFPHSTPEGHWLPQAWPWPVQIHFAHRVIALFITLAFLGWLWSVFRTTAVPRVLKGFAVAALLLLGVQIALGAEIIWSVRAPFQTTLHMLNGAIFFAVVWLTTFGTFRPLLEPVAEKTGEKESSAEAGAVRPLSALAHARSSS